MFMFICFTVRFIWLRHGLVVLKVVCLTRFAFCEGVYEALELRDGGSDYLGKGVNKVLDV